MFHGAFVQNNKFFVDFMTLNCVVNMEFDASLNFQEITKGEKLHDWRLKIEENC